MDFDRVLGQKYMGLESIMGNPQETSASVLFRVVTTHRGPNSCSASEAQGL